MNDAPTDVAGWLDALAHDLRNELNLLSMGAGLIEDESLRADLVGAAGGIRRSLERLVTLARVEQELLPTIVELRIDELIRLAAARATRERGASVRVDTTGASDAVVSTSGVWAERLVTDAIHLLAGVDPDASITFQISTGPGVLRLAADGEAPARHGASYQLASATCQRVAAALGGTCDIAADDQGCRVVITFRA